jgi:hypothetical protein
LEQEQSSPLSVELEHSIKLLLSYETNTLITTMPLGISINSTMEVVDQGYKLVARF